jgi:hypothetical protein
MNLQTIALASAAVGVATDPCTASELWSTVSSVPFTDPMVPIWILAAAQATLGGLDNIVHHELLLRLPWYSF